MPTWAYMTIDETMGADGETIRYAETTDELAPPGSFALDQLLQGEWIEILGKLGNHGWELCACVVHEADGKPITVYTFKRQKE